MSRAAVGCFCCGTHPLATARCCSSGSEQETTALGARVVARRGHVLLPSHRPIMWALPCGPCGVIVSAYTGSRRTSRTEAACRAPPCALRTACTCGALTQAVLHCHHNPTLPLQRCVAAALCAGTAQLSYSAPLCVLQHLTAQRGQPVRSRAAPTTGGPSQCLSLTNKERRRCMDLDDEVAPPTGPTTVSVDGEVFALEKARVTSKRSERCHSRGREQQTP